MEANTAPVAANQGPASVVSYASPDNNDGVPMYNQTTYVDNHCGFDDTLPDSITWIVKYVVETADADGMVGFTVSYEDAAGNVGAAETEAEAIEFFENRIRPVLAQDCYECHRSGGEARGGGGGAHPRALRAGEAGAQDADPKRQKRRVHGRERRLGER